MLYAFQPIKDGSKKALSIFLFTAYLFIFSNIKSQSSAMTIEQIVQQNLEAYNEKNLDAFMSSFSEDIAIYNFAETKATNIGLASLRERYKDLFERSPSLHSTILKRIVFDNKVIDHESIVGRLGAMETLEIIMIYEVKNQKIFKMTIIRK